MSVAPLQYDVCLGCGGVKPLAEFFEDRVEWEERGHEPMRCKACRENPNAVEKSEAAWGDLPPKVRKLFKLMFGNPGMKYSDAARQAGLDPRWGLAKLFKNYAAARLVYQQLLRDANLDMPYMAQKLRLMLHAQKPMWNPKRGDWDFFPDQQTQLRALTLLHQLHDQVGTRPDREGSTTVIVMNHNLDGEAPARTGAGFTATARIVDAEYESDG